MTHAYTYTQGQLTPVHPFWIDVLSSSTTQVSVPCFMRKQPYFFLFCFVLLVFFFPGRTLPECWIESLCVGDGRQPSSLLSNCTMQCPLALDTQQEALAMWHFPHSKCSETVMVVMVVVTISDEDDCHASVHGQHSRPLWFTL